MNTGERFPILNDAEIKWIPWRMVLPHERQAMANHSQQTLERLAYRGGLSVCEAVAVLEDRRWHRMEEADARARLKALVEAHIECSSG